MFDITKMTKNANFFLAYETYYIIQQKAKPASWK